MFLVYYIAMVGVGSAATDWANDGLFGDGWHFFGIGSSAYEEVSDEYTDAASIVNGYIEYASEEGVDTEDVEAALDTESEDFDADAAKEALNKFAQDAKDIKEATYTVVDEETMADEEETASYDDLLSAIDVYDKYDCEEPDPADYGIWVPGIPVLIGDALEKANCAEWLSGLILDGIVAGVGAVLGFVPQMLVLFLLLAFLEACGYMSRIAFVLDRVFRKFKLSGKSFIPMLIGTGCGVRSYGFKND